MVTKNKWFISNIQKWNKWLFLDVNNRNKWLFCKKVVSLHRNSVIRKGYVRAQIYTVY